MKIFFSAFVGQHLLMYEQNFRESFLLEISKNFGILWKATVKTNASLSGFLKYRWSLV